MVVAFFQVVFGISSLCTCTFSITELGEVMRYCGQSTSLLSDYLGSHFGSAISWIFDVDQVTYPLCTWFPLSKMGLKQCLSQVVSMRITWANSFKQLINVSQPILSHRIMIALVLVSISLQIINFMRSVLLIVSPLHSLRPSKNIH